MDQVSESAASKRGDAGLGIMEVIVAVFVALILGSILLYLGRLGYAMYKLSSATGEVAEELEKARTIARDKNQAVQVIFKAKEGKFGVDRNGNSRLDNIEAEEMPEGVLLTEDAVVIFSRTGQLAAGSKEPEIIISNSTDTRSISISSAGAIDID